MFFVDINLVSERYQFDGFFLISFWRHKDISLIVSF